MVYYFSVTLWLIEDIIYTMVGSKICLGIVGHDKEYSLHLLYMRKARR